VTNEPSDDDGGPLHDLLRLQADFQARLAEETLRYLRRMQAAVAPPVPGTVLRPDGAPLEAAGSAGSDVRVEVEIENRQRAHCMVSPTVSPLVTPDGTTWFPDAQIDPPSLLLAPDEVATMAVGLPLPADLPAGTYSGALLLPGFRSAGVALRLHVEPEQPAADPATEARA